MPKIKLSKLTVDSIEPTNKAVYYYDTDLTGFFLRVMPSGAKAWGYEYRVGSGRKGRKNRITIAAVGKVTPDEARKIARRHSAEVTLGKDPAAEKQAASKAMTVSELIELYEQEGCYVQRGTRMGEPMKDRTKQYTIARLRHHVLPLLGRLRVEGIGSAEIERMVRDIEKGNTAKDEKVGPRKRIIVRGGEGAARKVVRDFSAVLSFAVRRGMIARNSCATAGVRKTDNQRDRFLKIEEITRLGAAFRDLEAEGTNPKAINIARLWVLTGCRRDEIAGLKWSEVDFDEGLFRFSNSKTGKNIRPLGSAARTILLDIAVDDTSPYVFPAESGNGHYQGTKGVWPKVLAKAELIGVTPHTLRHSIGSAAASKGEALPMIGAILGHRNVRSTAIYAHVQHDPSRLATDRVVADINAALTGSVKAKASGGTLGAISQMADIETDL
ncbi:site-specific integrase [Mesorhizobium sp. YR577]|uniref:tyrosine-type recombinase/integrase n=1 Tax=Mesorhizobium sp. YR577 TaxID=1884373 RepID=UPI0008F03794|nr:site-specific integrase [Mesorhizobium sp. YR577]SFU09488.1 Site-specific recombinase XerD [Mesorhizobium sp. YR577]